MLIIVIQSIYHKNINIFFLIIIDENKTQTVEYVLKPIEYLPNFRKNSNSWALTAQYVTGRHFLTAFELNEGIIIVSHTYTTIHNYWIYAFVQYF